MNLPARKLSEIMKEMAERLLRYPVGGHSSEADHVALMFANFAWNEAVGLTHPRDSYRSAWKVIETENPEMWSEFKSTDVGAMLDDLVAFKKKHYPRDLRRILTCGMLNGNICVQWLNPVARHGRLKLETCVRERLLQARPATINRLLASVRKKANIVVVSDGGAMIQIIPVGLCVLIPKFAGH